jgi:hypothetical protein
MRGTNNLVLRSVCWTLAMLTFLLWLLLLFLCWPLALGALLLYPIVWLLLLPFRLLGVAVEGVLKLVYEVIVLPVTIFKRLTASGSHG